MRSVKQTISHLQSAWNWGILGLVLALAVTLGSGEVASAALRTINLNTGYDQWAASPALIPVGGLDNEWRVVFDLSSTLPPPSLATGRPADVVTIGPPWLDPSTTPPYNGTQGSRWISINTAATVPPPSTSYDYAYYFTLPPGFTNAQLTMDFNADDYIDTISLNNCSVFVFPGSGGGFSGPPLPITFSQQNCFKSGSDVNVVTVTVVDAGGSPTGLIVAGSVTYDDCDRQPLTQTPGLTSITFFESTYASPTSTTFANAQQLTTQLSGTLSGPANFDFQGAIGLEFYDVFYSNWDGTVNPNGEFVTIEAVSNVGAPSGGGLNIGAVQLNFANGSSQLANFVSSFVALGDNAIPADVGKAVDTNTVTDTTMGNTVGQTQRLRVTVGFPCPCTRPPSGMVAWYPLDEQTGATVQDIAGFDNNGVPQPGAVGGSGPTPVAGQVNGALYFVNNYIDVPPATNLDLANSDLTIDGWFAWGWPGSPLFGNIPLWSPGQTKYYAIVDKLDPSTNPTSGYALFVRTNAKVAATVTVTVDLVFVLGNNTYLANIYTGTNNPPLTPPWPYSGQRLYVAVTMDQKSNIGTFYLNGNPIGYFTPATGVNNPVPLWIGKSRLPVNGIEFSLDEIEIFKVPLSQQAIQTIYSAGANSTGKCKRFVDLGITPTNPTTNPITVTYATSGCFNQEMFLVLNAPNMDLPWSYLNTSGVWTPVPTPPSLITPWMSSGPADGLYALFSGSVPTGGLYDVYLGCDFVPNGHLDIDPSGNVNGVYGDLLGVTVQ